jgi:uncharacterized membrane protein
MASPLAPSPPRSSSPSVAETSLGLSRKQAALLAYSAGCVTGLLVLWLEGRDAETRWHAAQSVFGFGALTLVAVLLLGIAAIGILSSLALFRASLWGAQVLLVLGIALWVWTMARVAMGGTPHWPLIASRVDRLAGKR